MRRYYLGFDGGGTKTEAALLDASGTVLAQGFGGPSNPLRAGYDVAFASLKAAAEAALACAKLRVSDLHAICAGLAGAGRPRVLKRVMAFLVEQFPGPDIHVTTDFEIALEAAAGSGPAVVLIAGTGSVAVGRDSSGRIVRAGGVGPWIGDEGSAFDIGRRAVAAVARMRDALGPVTLLAELIPERLECSSWDQLTERIAERPDDVFPRVFPVVLEAAAADDATAREILFRAALGLSQLAGSVIRRLDLSESEFVLAKSGGVFGRLEFFDEAIDNLLRTVAPRAHIGPLPVAPAVGAARLAMRLLPLPEAESVHGRAG
jgi:N-acetylglucosamine kinase-like BadF-type ATPase